MYKATTTTTNNDDDIHQRCRSTFGPPDIKKSGGFSPSSPTLFSSLSTSPISPSPFLKQNRTEHLQFREEMEKLNIHQFQGIFVFDSLSSLNQRIQAYSPPIHYFSLKSAEKSFSKKPLQFCL